MAVVVILVLWARITYDVDVSSDSRAGVATVRLSVDHHVRPLPVNSVVPGQ
ncbi:hypothetical protein [Actinoplanes awajinensis]|uniref:hypothetical protein n=1 Tax=Actinoplanes awajinensis TaxID=135946 RepID=UPI0012FC3B1D|nr:hypothetical protein [Actinoplanes awajinensis]